MLSACSALREGDGKITEFKKVDWKKEVSVVICSDESEILSLLNKI